MKLYIELDRLFMSYLSNVPTCKYIVIYNKNSVTFHIQSSTYSFINFFFAVTFVVRWVCLVIQDRILFDFINNGTLEMKFCLSLLPSLLGFLLFLCQWFTIHYSIYCLQSLLKLSCSKGYQCVQTNQI